MRKRSIISDVQLSYKASEFPSVQITGVAEAVRVCYQCIPDEELGLREYFGMLLLNRACRVTGRTILFVGSLTKTVAEPRHIFQCALLSNAAGIILFHNHPSGNVRPSAADVDLTRRIQEGCRLFEIELHDHIILSGFPEQEENYFSFAMNDLLEQS